jgi:inorganic pyrophosphatase
VPSLGSPLLGTQRSRPIGRRSPRRTALRGAHIKRSTVNSVARGSLSTANDKAFRMPNILSLPHRLDIQSRSCRAVIETPAGCRSKYDYDEESGLFTLAGILPAGLAFPLAFGFVPGTLAEDGDPVDVLVLADEGLPVGCLLEVTLLGVIEAEQTEQGRTCRNDRLVAKVSQSRTFADVHDLERLGKAFTDELVSFFVTYNELKGKRFEVKATGGPERACALIEQASC